MCGIVGFLNLDKRPAEKETLRKMCDSIAHRGPDGEGFFTDRCVGLGHRRLAIIDLSEHGRQPMSSPDGRYTICYNGEVYNYQELRPELEALGAVFSSTCDTEVILWAYHYWGPQCLQRFNGMWALAIWDSREETLFLSRDRLSVKPLYVYKDDKTMLFASEIKALIASGLYTAQPDYEWFYQYYTTGYTDSGTRTFFKDVELFPKASYAIWKDGKELERKSYWAFDLKKVREKYDYEHPEQEFERLIRRSVELRLRSDTPVGTCLSGGLDSSALVGIATEMLDGERMHSFTSVYDEAQYNEKEYAQEVAVACNTRAHYIHPQPEEAMDYSLFGTYCIERPIAGATIMSQLSVMRMATSHVKVLIDGQGSDEMLGGYLHYFTQYLNELYTRAYVKKTIPKRDYKRALAKAKQNPAAEPFIKTHKQFLLLRKTRMDNPDRLKFLRWMYWKLYWGINLLKKAGQWLRRPANRAGEAPPKAAEKPKAKAPMVNPVLVNAQFAEKMKNAPDLTPKFTNPFDGEDELTATLYRQFFFESIPLLLLSEDANSMAFSIEARTPFMDYEFVEFVFGLDMDWKIHDCITKYIQRMALDKYIPDKVLKRKDKMGYPTPYALWLRGPLKDEIEELLFSKKLQDRQLVDMDALRHYWDLHQSGAQDHTSILYKVISTEMWFRIFIDKDTEVPDLRTAPLMATVENS